MDISTVIIRSRLDVDATDPTAWMTLRYDMTDEMPGSVLILPVTGARVILIC